MTRPAQCFLAMILATACWADWAEAGPGTGGGQGGGKGGGAGRERCGSTLTVVLPDGSEKSYTPAEAFLKDMPRRDINQGEETRRATALTDLLKTTGATWVKVQDCAASSQDLPSGLPVEGEIYVVVTGRGSLKFAREIRPGVFANVIQNVRHLRFHGAADTPGSKRSKGQR